jgi:hypothetical protein
MGIAYETLRFESDLRNLKLARVVRIDKLQQSRFKNDTHPNDHPYKGILAKRHRRYSIRVTVISAGFVRWITDSRSVGSFHGSIIRRKRGLS